MSIKSKDIIGRRDDRMFLAFYSTKSVVVSKKMKTMNKKAPTKTEKIVHNTIEWTKTQLP